MKRTLALLLSLTMLMSLLIVPANAADEDVVLKITPDKTSINTATAQDVTYTVSVEVKDSSVKIGGIQFTLDAPSGMTIPTKLNADNFQINSSELKLVKDEYDNVTGGIFDTFGYTKETYIFIASGTTEDRNLNKNAEIMKIKVSVAENTTGSLNFTAKNVEFAKVDGGAVKWTYRIDTTAVEASSATSNNLPVAIPAPVTGGTPKTAISDTNYTGSITWTPDLTSGGKFAASTEYTANVTLTAKGEYKFASGVTPIVAGADKVENVVVGPGGSTLTFNAKFPETGSLPAATVTAPTAKPDLKYTGSAQVLLGSVATATGGTVKYSLDNSSWSDAIPMGTNAGEYTVYYKAVGDSTHSDSAVDSISATIGPKDISTATIGTIAGQPYTGSAITPDLTVTDGTATLEKDKDYTVSGTDNKYVGTNTAKLTITGQGNYTGTKDAYFTITAVDQNPTFTTPKDLVMGGHMLDLRDLVSNAQGEMTFTIASGTAATLSGYTLTSTAAITGEVKITVSIAAKDVDGDHVNEYNAFSKSEAITVNVVNKTPASVTTAPKAVENLKYTGDEQALVTEGVASGGEMQYSLGSSPWSTEIPTAKDAGTYTVEYKVVGDSYHTDYTPTSNTVSVTIGPKVLHSSDLEQSGGSATKVYDGNANSSITVRVKASSLCSGDTLAITGTAVYNSADVADANQITFTPIPITTGNYTLAASEVLTITGAKITARDVTIASVTATPREYDKTNLDVTVDAAVTLVKS